MQKLTECPMGDILRYHARDEVVRHQDNTAEWQARKVYEVFLGDTVVAKTTDPGAIQDVLMLLEPLRKDTTRLRAALCAIAAGNHTNT